MSSIKLSPNASGTGIFTIAAPNSNTDRTLNLPDQSGTIISTDSSGAVILPRVDSSNEGGQINFNRASDNTAVWSIDSFGSTSTPTLRFINGATVAAAIDGSNNVGIGTSSPAYRLDVTSASASNGSTVIRNVNTQPNVSALLHVTGTAYSYAGVGASSVWLHGAGGNVTIGSDGAFYTSFISNGAERARIDSSGNVGIGTSSPSRKLQIYSQNGGASFSVGQAICGDGTGSLPALAWGDSNFDGKYAAIDAYRGSGYGNGGMRFYVWDGTTGAPLTSAIERMRITSGGNLLVGTTTDYIDTTLNVATSGSRHAGNFENNNVDTYAAMVVRNNATSGTRRLIDFRQSSTTVGSITHNGTSTSYNTSSDYRLKHDIAPMTGALAKVAALKPVTYKWNADDSDGEGFIAHELAEVVPQCVTGEKDAVDADGNPVYQGIDTSFLVVTLTAAIQEQQAIIESLTTRIAALEAR